MTCSAAAVIWAGSTPPLCKVSNPRIALSSNVATTRGSALASTAPSRCASEMQATKADILNTKTREELQQWLAQRKQMAGW